MRVEPAKRAPRPEVAFWLSVFLPGAGQIYAGAPLRGLAFLFVAYLGFLGVLDSKFFTETRRQYQGHGVLGATLMAATWYGAAWHARRFAERLKEWPRLYRFLARPSIRHYLVVARAELLMALLFAFFLVVCSLGARAPAWLPEPPRYWFLYELFVAIYLAVFHGIVEVRGRSQGLEDARIMGFAVMALLASGSLILVTSVPTDVFLFAFLIALPSCWFSLRHRSREETGRQVMRVFMIPMLGFFAFFAFGIVVNVWEIISEVPQYQMRLVKDEAVFFATLALLYYLLRAASEVVMHLPDSSSQTRVR